jgi:hypothetical protein
MNASPTAQGSLYESGLSIQAFRISLADSEPVADIKPKLRLLAVARVVFRGSRRPVVVACSEG